MKIPTSNYDLFRETFGRSVTGRQMQIKPYGFLEGLAFRFVRPLENMDASRPYFVTVSLTRAGRGSDLVHEEKISGQMICRTIGGRFIDFPGAYKGESPLL